MLKKLDPRRAKEIDSKNPVRLIRAIEIAKKLGRVPLLGSRTSGSLEVRLPCPTTVVGQAHYDFEFIGIKIDQTELNKKIHNRLIYRLKHGLIAEVKKLHEQGLSWKRLEELGLEYRYLALFLQNKLTREEMLEQLEKEIIKYSKRQLTWFKRDKRIKWLKI